MNHFLKLIRWPNLLIILLSMSLIFFVLINHILGVESFAAGLTFAEFLLLVLATLFITIGGYLINDFFDIDADQVNKPGKNQVGRYFPVFTVQVLYWAFTITGVLAGIFLAWKIDQLNFGLIFILCAGLLWFYSERYQCIPIVGNIVVAALSALSFGIVWLFQFLALSSQPDNFALVKNSVSLINNLVLVYVAFAFIVSFLREVIKDIEDVKGDSKFKCRTFSVAYGIEKAKILAICIAVVGLAGSVWFQSVFIDVKFWMLFAYFMIIDILYVTIIYLLRKAEQPGDFQKLSLLTKVLMVAGILSVLIFYFEF